MTCEVCTRRCTRVVRFKRGGKKHALCANCEQAMKAREGEAVNFLDEFEYRELFSGLRLKIGLRQQGHIPTVERMLAEGATWDEIGRAIGWHGPTAQRWYEHEKEKR